jgi:hypothetical protein
MGHSLRDWLDYHPFATRIGFILFLGAILGMGSFFFGGAVPTFGTIADAKATPTGPARQVLTASVLRVDDDDRQPLPLREKPLTANKGDRLVVAAVFRGTDTSPLEPLPVSLPDPISKQEFRGTFNAAKAAAASGDQLRFGKRVDVMSTIIQAAAATKVDPVYLIAVADKESDLNVKEDSARSSAQGLFQFVDGTWLDMVGHYGAKHGLKAEQAAIRFVDGAPVVSDPGMRAKILGLRDNPYYSAVMTGEMIHRDKDTLLKAAGRDLTFTDVYMAHFLGRISAAKFIELRRRSPGESAAANFSQAAANNPTIFYDSGRALSVAEVYSRIEASIEKRVARYRMVGTGIAKVNALPAVTRAAAASYGSYGGAGGGSGYTTSVMSFAGR